MSYMNGERIDEPDDYDYQKQKEGRKIDFSYELRSLINRYSLENTSNTPDFVLAEYLVSCLNAFDTAVQQRENYYGRDPRPSKTPLQP